MHRHQADSNTESPVSDRGVATPPVLCLLGPTAVGKTDVTRLLLDTPAEVINADSMQVYRRLDIGTAKPDRSLRSKLPHHLLDIVEPWEHFDVGRFVTAAQAAATAILARDHLPVIVGGTGYYFKHFLFGLPQAPAADPDVRRRVEARLETEGLAALRRELLRLDPASAERIDANDAYRIQRALEVYEQCGRPLSSFAQHQVMRSDYSVRIVELVRDRAHLHERINRRVDEMFAAGLRGEVEQLVAAGASPAWPSMRAIGYREFFDDTGSVRPVSEDARIAERIKTASRRYAKRQVTFFRQFPTRLQIEADARDELAALIEKRVALLDSL